MRLQTGIPVGCRTGGAAWPEAAAFIVVHFFLHPEPGLPVGAAIWECCGVASLIWQLSPIEFLLKMLHPSGQGDRPVPHILWNHNRRASLGQDSVC